MTFTGTAALCTALKTAQSTAAAAACLSSATLLAIGATGLVTIGMDYYQPKETSDKVYAGLPRFSKGESMKYVGLANVVAASAFPSVTCGTAKALLGASNLIAGAAVAFGAATLAF
jgi:hypothetical protein